MNNGYPAQNGAPDDFQPQQGTGQGPLGGSGTPASPGSGDMQQSQPPASHAPAPRSYYDNGPGLYGRYSSQPAKRATNVAAIIIIVGAIGFILFTMVSIFMAFLIVM